LALGAADGNLGPRSAKSAIANFHGDMGNMTMEYHGSMDKKGHKSRASLGKPPRNGLDSEQRDHTHYASVNWDYDWMGL